MELETFLKLKQLFLSFNKINILPDTLVNLKQLKYLYVHHNQLKSIPLWIIQLQELERLDFSYNQVFEMPDLSVMDKLSEIDLQENQLEYFPWELMGKPNLKILIVSGNPFILTEEEEKMLENHEKNLNSDKPVIVY